MIFPAHVVAGLLSGDLNQICRPAVRPNGQLIGYRVGGVYPLQPGRFAPHVGHIRIQSLELRPAGELRAEGDWEMPLDWADNLILAVMEVTIAERCERCA